MFYSGESLKKSSLADSSSDIMNMEEGGHNDDYSKVSSALRFVGPKVTIKKKWGVLLYESFIAHQSYEAETWTANLHFEEHQNQNFF